jgi:hypothetical protein
LKGLEMFDSFKLKMLDKLRRLKLLTRALNSFLVEAPNPFGAFLRTGRIRFGIFTEIHFLR